MKANNSSDRLGEMALRRFRVVSFVEDLVDGGMMLSEALAQGASRPWPENSSRYYAVRTIEDWYYAYKKGGFDALRMGERADKGKSRAIDQETGQWIIAEVCRYPHMPVKVLYRHWENQGKDLPSLRSIYRYLARKGYDRRSVRRGRLESGPTKAFCAAYVNELWMVDFSPGPTIRCEDGKILRTHLCLLVDDCSRLIPFAAYYPKADTESFHHTLKEAVTRRGIPQRLYTDQGKPFVNMHSRTVCANLGVRLIHAKPYHAWSKGKCERLIQTIQRDFEASLRLEGNQAASIEELNEKFSVWIQTVYHLRVHSATGESPEQIYQQQLDSLHHLDPRVDIDTLFYTQMERTVRKDGTVRIDNVLYEVELSLRALKVQLRFDPFTRRRIEVWRNGSLCCLATPANLQLNAELGGGRSYEKRD
jgi:transposase InsO family protein